MGYYTNYSLTINETYTGGCVPHEKECIIIKRLGEINGYWSNADVDDYTDPFNIISDDSMKWYNHDKDMLLLSKEFPEYWFILDGHGEEWDDIWSAMYHDGKMQHVDAEIVYPDFSEEGWCE